MFEQSPDNAPDTVMECKICWYQYRTEEGDPISQIPAGVAFYQLPENWVCPQCCNPKQGFIVAADD